MSSRAAAACKLCWGAYLILGSLYCFVAYVPLTYVFVISTPPYAWITSFARYNLLVLWAGVAATVPVFWTRRSERSARVAMALRAGVALIVSIFNPIPHLQNDARAFAWSMALLAALLIVSAWELLNEPSGEARPNPESPISYRDAVLVGLLAGVTSCAVPRVHAAMQFGLALVERRDLALIFWATLEHVVLAIVIASFINLARRSLSAWSRNATVLGPGVVAFVVSAGVAFGCASFFQTAFNVGAVPAWSYAAMLGTTSTVWGMNVVARLLGPRRESQMAQWRAVAMVVLFVGGAFYAPVLIGRDDYEHVIEITATVALWLVVAIAICRLRPPRKPYSVAFMVAILVGVLFGYKGLQRTQMLWASDIGHTQADIARETKMYAAQNTSFRVVDTILGNAEEDPCDDTCRTLRQYTNLPSARIGHEVNLVEKMEPMPGAKPNIFILVIDSLRPDYVGAYNPRVDFTPNLDALARDSAVMRRAYANYAGTTLSEPSIWSGTLLPHAHYPAPFEKVNSLKKLARADGYQLVVSYDVVVRKLMEPSEDIVLLDTDKMWAGVEMSSTMQQLETVLDKRPAGAKPVLFYAQPMNVHVHANNSLPKRTAENWRTRDGFDDRIAYAVHQTDQFLGSFVKYLKARGLYDNSIIVITADHGDATGELGRLNHSLIIYPEVMHVPMIVHLPAAMAKSVVWDENRLSALMDIAPSLYFLLGHGPTRVNPLFGRPMFATSAAEFERYPRPDLFLASDARAVYGILSDDGRMMYTTYDAPVDSMLFDLAKDPTALHNVLTPEAKKKYDARIVEYLKTIAEFYGNAPAGKQTYR